MKLKRLKEEKPTHQRFVEMLMEAIRDREQDFPTIAKLSQQDIEKIYNTFLNTLEE